MSISSSLNAGVAGLRGNAQRLASISDNMANSATYGYKRVETDFRSMVMGGQGGSYAAGGVQASTNRLIDQQMPLISTSNPTDLAVNGRGMLPVTSGTALDGGGELPFMMTSTGSFRPDENGILRSPTGEVLLGWKADRNGDIPTQPRDSMGGLEPVRITDNQFQGDPTTLIEMGVNLPATAAREGEPGEARTATIEIFGNLGEAMQLDVEFDPTGEADNEWRMSVTDPETGELAGEYLLRFNDGAEDGGTLAEVETLGAGGDFDPETGALTMTIAGNEIDFDLGAPGTGDGLTQVSDSFIPDSLNANGAPIGNFTSVEVDANGFVKANYDSGATRLIYQVPVVDVPNPNGLISLDNQTFAPSGDSGSFFLWDAGDGPTGDVAGFAREESATDVAEELTQMIQTQRAYSSNAKVIQTVDEMLQETTNLKR